MITRKRQAPVFENANERSGMDQLLQMVFRETAEPKPLPQDGKGPPGMIDSPSTNQTSTSRSRLDVMKVAGTGAMAAAFSLSAGTTRAQTGTQGDKGMTQAP